MYMFNADAIFLLNIFNPCLAETKDVKPMERFRGKTILTSCFYGDLRNTNWELCEKGKFVFKKVK